MPHGPSVFIVSTIHLSAPSLASFPLRAVCRCVPDASAGLYGIHGCSSSFQPGHSGSRPRVVLSVDEYHFGSFSLGTSLISCLGSCRRACLSALRGASDDAGNPCSIGWKILLERLRIRSRNSPVAGGLHEE